MPRSSSFFLFPNATSNGPRPPVLWCPVFRLSVFVRLTSAFFPLLRHDTRLCRRKTIMYRHNKLFLPSSSCKPSFPGPPRLDLFSAFHFLCIANGKRKRGEERFLTKKRRRWTNEWRKDRGEIVVRRKLNDGITLTIIYDFLSAVDFLLWNFEEIKRQRFSVRWLRWKYELGIELNRELTFIRGYYSWSALLVISSYLQVQLSCSYSMLPSKFIINFNYQVSVEFRNLISPNEIRIYLYPWWN